MIQVYKMSTYSTYVEFIQKWKNMQKKRLIVIVSCFFLPIMPADEYDQPSNSPINIHKLNQGTFWFYDILCINQYKESIKKQ